MADAFFTQINQLYSELAAYTSWEPTPELLELYAKIIALCTADVSPSQEETIINDERIQTLLPKLRTTWGEARGALEDYWSAKITAAPTSEEAIEIFNSYPSMKNYTSMCPLEMSLVTSALGRVPRKMAIIGCGPLPLTGLSYVQYAQQQQQQQQQQDEQSFEILNIDIVPERIDASKKLCSLIQRTAGMEFLLADGRSQIKELEQCDVVLLASVVGITDDDKSRMLDSIAKVMNPKSLILTRGSFGLARVLYPKLDFESLAKWAPTVQPSLMAVELDGPTKHGIYVLKPQRSGTQ